MPEKRGDNDEPVPTTRIDGEDVRLLVHIERLEEDTPAPEDPSPRPE